LGSAGDEGALAVAASTDAVAINGYYSSLFDIARGPLAQTLPVTAGADAFVTQRSAQGELVSA